MSCLFYSDSSFDLINRLAGAVDSECFCIHDQRVFSTDVPCAMYASTVTIGGMMAAVLNAFMA